MDETIKSGESQGRMTFVDFTVFDIDTKKVKGQAPIVRSKVHGDTFEIVSVIKGAWIVKSLNDGHLGKLPFEAAKNFEVLTWSA